MPIQTDGVVQNIKIPTVGDLATVQVALQNNGIIVTAATFVLQQDNREDIPANENDDLLLLNDEDEDTEKYDWQNESPVEDFGNLDID